MKENKIKFAVVGCGHIGKRHAEMVTRDQDAELVALCDIRPREELGIEGYEVPFFAGLQELLQSCMTQNTCLRYFKEAYTTFSASASVSAIGFSITTLQPASIACTAIDACKPFGVQILMTSI